MISLEMRFTVVQQTVRDSSGKSTYPRLRSFNVDAPDAPAGLKVLASQIGAVIVDAIVRRGDEATCQITTAEGRHKLVAVPSPFMVLID